MESNVVDIIASAPGSILGFILVVLFGVGYLFKYVIDMQKELIGQIISQTLDKVDSAIENNTKAVLELKLLVGELVREMKDDSGKEA